MTPIERAARALCAEGGFDPDEIMPNDGPRWRYYTRSASTVLRELREPSPAMEVEGENEIDMDRLAYGSLDTVSATDIWQTMIDAALREG